MFGLAHQMSSEFGCVGVLVDAKAAAVAFYARYGFVELPVDTGANQAAPVAMFVSLNRIPAP